MLTGVVWLNLVLSFDQDQLNDIYATAPSVSSNILAQVLSCGSTLVTSDSASLGLPDFPLENLSRVSFILELVSRRRCQASIFLKI